MVVNKWCTWDISQCVPAWVSVRKSGIVSLLRRFLTLNRRSSCSECGLWAISLGPHPPENKSLKLSLINTWTITSPLAVTKDYLGNFANWTYSRRLDLVSRGQTLPLATRDQARLFRRESLAHKRGWSFGALPSELRSKVNLMPTTVGCVMDQHRTSSLAAVLVSLCITFIPGGTNGCTGEPTCILCVNFWIVVLYV